MVLSCVILREEIVAKQVLFKFTELNPILDGRMKIPVSCGGGGGIRSLVLSLLPDVAEGKEKVECSSSKDLSKLRKI